MRWGVHTTERSRSRLDYPQALLELGLRRGQLGVRTCQVLDFLVELLLDGRELLGVEAVEAHFERGRLVGCLSVRIVYEGVDGIQAP